MRYILLMFVLTACAQPDPILLSSEGGDTIVLGCDISGNCISHSVPITGTVYHRGMVHQPENEAHMVWENGTEGVVLK